MPTKFAQGRASTELRAKIESTLSKGVTMVTRRQANAGILASAAMAAAPTVAVAQSVSARKLMQSWPLCR
jgi:hypothetical protein